MWLKEKRLKEKYPPKNEQGCNKDMTDAFSVKVFGGCHWFMALIKSCSENVFLPPLQNWTHHSSSSQGTVIIIANHGDRIDIPAGSMLENKIVSGNLRIMDH